MRIKLSKLRQLIRETVLLEAKGDKCLNCGTPKEEDDRFCGECGANVGEECIGLKCDAHVPVDDGYCSVCGSPQLRKDPEARETIQKSMKMKEQLKLREKLWKDAGGKSKDVDNAEMDEVMENWEIALENRVMAKLSRDPKSSEMDQKFRDASAALKKYIRNNVEVGARYYASLVKAGIANEEEKEMAENLNSHLQKYPGKESREKEHESGLEKQRRDNDKRSQDAKEAHEKRMSDMGKEHQKKMDDLLSRNPELKKIEDLKKKKD